MNKPHEARRTGWSGDDSAASPRRLLHSPAHRFPAQAIWCALPEQITPQFASPAHVGPANEDAWLYEIEFNGYRVLARIDAGDIRLVTGEGEDWTSRLLPLRRALGAMRLLPGWYDGEIVVLNERGIPDFDALQRSLQSQRTHDVVLYLFDLPYLDNYDLRAAPLVARRTLLERLLENKASDVVRLSEAFAGPAQSVLPAARELGLDGLVAKRKDSPYQPGRHADWLQLKCGHRQAFVVGGFTTGPCEGSGGALMLGVYDGQGLLRHVGHVATGLDAGVFQEMRPRLRQLVRQTTPFAGDILAVGGDEQWLEPVLVVEASFAQWTPHGRIREAVFLRWLDDRDARAVVRETG